MADKQYNIRVNVIGNAQFQKFQRSVDKLNKSAVKSAVGIDKMNRSMSGLGRVAKLAGGAMAVFYSARGLTNIIAQADAMRNLEASFSTLLGSGDRAAAMMEEVFSIAKRTGAPINDVAEAAQRLAVGMGEMGASNAQITTVTETFIKLGRVGGASMADVNGALVQFSQGLSSGRLQGDEFRSISERLPLVMRALSKELNVTVGELKQLGTDGKITADVMANAMLNAAEDVDGQFSKLPLTFEQASNNFKTMLVQFSRSTAVVQTLDLLARGLGTVTSAIEASISWFQDFGQALYNMEPPAIALAATIGSMLVPAVVAGLTAMTVAVKAFIVSNPFTLIAAAVAAVAVLLYNNWEIILNGIAQFAQRTVIYFQDLRKAALEALKPLVVGVATIFDAIWNDAIAPAMTFAIEQLQGLSFKVYNAFGSKKALALNEQMMELNTRLSVVSDEAGKAGARIDSAMKSAASASGAAAVKLVQLRKDAEALNTPLEETKIVVEDLSVNLENFEAAAGNAGGAAKKLAKATKEVKTEMEKAADSIESSMGSAITDGIINAAKGGKDAFKNMAQSILEDIARMIIQLKIIKPLMNALFPGGGGGLFGSARGNYFPQGITGKPLTAFATGGIVGGRSVIGSNLIGEAGPEAVLPLRRHNGRMGVEASPVNVNVINNAGAEVQVSESKGNDGTRTIDIMIEQKVKNAFATGGMDKIMQSRFGSRPVGA